MQKTKDQLYELVKDIKIKTEFENEIKKLQKEYDDLIDEDVLALLIVDQLGRNKQNICKISDLKPGIECTIFGKISSISKSRNFTRKNGSYGQVVNLEIMDDIGSCNLVLWNKDVELVKNKTIKKESNVKIINGYIKDGFNGLEINIGRWGLIEVNPEDMPEYKNIESENKDRISGKVTLIEPTNAFFRDDGQFGFVTKMHIQNKDGKTKKIILWDEKVKEIQSYKPGDNVEISNVSLKSNNGKNELHVNGKSIIKKL